MRGSPRSPVGKPGSGLPAVRDNHRVTDVLDDLLWRGLLQDSTDLDELREHLAAGPVTFYVGLRPDRRRACTSGT